MLESSDDYCPSEGRKALTFCLMNRFLLVSKEGLAYVMHLVKEPLKCYSYMPIILVEMILCLDGLNGYPDSNHMGSPILLLVKFQTFCLGS